MTIKEVEKQTGLTAKSIRYYENKGLLTVERNEGNDYRSYSEVEVNRLKRIKLLRYLEFSVEEVKALLDMEAKEVEKVLEQKGEYFSDLRERCLNKRELCLSLAKDYKNDEEKLNLIVSEYNQYVEVIESDEMAELEDELKFLGAPSLSLTILQTLMFLGPILGLFTQIEEGNFENIALVAGLAVFGAMWITGLWIFYFIQRRQNKKYVKKQNRATMWMIPMLIVAIVLFAVLMIGLDGFIQKVFIPEEFLFYSYSDFAQNGMIAIGMITLIFVGGTIICKFSPESRKLMEATNGFVKLWNMLGKWKVVASVIWIFLFYCCAISFTVVTEDSIICHSPIHPKGVIYSYSDITKITTGVGQKNITFLQHERKGQFYYRIELDGKNITFLTGVTSNDQLERYNENTYLWFEEFDQKLVELGISKESDSTGYENINMGQEYIERFYRILENK